MPRYSKTERVGVNAVERIVVDDLGWIFREQPIVDMGIDAHMELTTDGEPSGQLVALQIKTSSREIKGANSYVYYGKLEHLDYWLGHALPVVLVVHFPEVAETLWVQVTAEAITKTKRAWRISVPKRNRLGAKSKSRLAKVFEGTPAQQRLRRLSIHLPLMRHIKAGNKVSVELHDWVNKSLSRTSIEVFVDDERDDKHSDLRLTYFTGYSIMGLAEEMFPWASVRLDDDFYEIHDEYRSRDHWRDTESEVEEYPDELVPSRDRGEHIYPYAELGGGEVQVFRLKLELNELGEAFLVILDFTG